MMIDLIRDIVQQEIARHMASQPGIKAAEISAYDPKRHAIKATLKPDDIETGWFPVGTSHVSNGGGVVMGPGVGDQIVVGFLGGNMDSPVHLGRLHSDKEQPPTANSGEIIMKQGNVTFKITGSGIDVTGGYVKVNGHAIDDTHTHTGVTPGSGVTGVPS
jgi:uncharacterized protein involved in type VI secretion and phage assembly